MQNICKSCGHSIESENELQFCPYCGKRLDHENSVSSENSALSVSSATLENNALSVSSAKLDGGETTTGHAKNSTTGDLGVAAMMDSIWGETANQKQAFLKKVNQCIGLLKYHSKQGIKSSLPGTSANLSRFEEKYKEIKRSGNRKILLRKIEDYLEYLRKVLDDIQDISTDDAMDRVRDCADKIDHMHREFYSFLGIDYVASFKDTDIANIANIENIEDNFSIQTAYSKEMLQNLYAQVLIAYEKYKRCVEDNNMFAAFASDSDYGFIGDFSIAEHDYFPELTRYISEYVKDKKRTERKEKTVAGKTDNNSEANGTDGRDEETAEEKKYRKVMAYMLLNNEKEYTGMLDEEYEPHVNAFWHGLEELCKMIDDHISVEYDDLEVGIDDDEKDRIGRLISGRDYKVDEEKIMQAYEWKNRIEEWGDEIYFYYL